MINALDFIRDNIGLCLGEVIEKAYEKGVKDTTYKWIKPSEQLPEDYTYVLCWYEYFRYGDYNRMFKTYGVGFYDSVYNKWGGDVRGHKVNVIAWMPLPEPPRFKGGKK